MPLNIGSALPLSYLKLFTVVSNIELYPFSGSVLARAAGAGAILTVQSLDSSVLKFKSGWNLKVSTHCIGSIGGGSNALHKFQSKRKAGIIRSLGIRPTVRGVAMNPCDHPHGGVKVKSLHQLVQELLGVNWLKY